MNKGFHAMKQRATTAFSFIPSKPFPLSRAGQSNFIWSQYESIFRMDKFYWVRKQERESEQ